MNGFTEHRESGASERPGDSDKVMTWDASFAMLPLVERIAADILNNHKRLKELEPELEQLERLRRELAWPRRARRYELQEAIAAIGKELQAARTELDTLGVTLLDSVDGMIGFPTLVNNRRAFFTWVPGEDSLHFWSYSGDSVRRPVPEAWTKPTPAPKERSHRGKKSSRNQ